MNIEQACMKDVKSLQLYARLWISVCFGFSEILYLSQCKTVLKYISEFRWQHKPRSYATYLESITKSDQVTGVDEVRVNAKKSTISKSFEQSIRGRVEL